MLRSLFSWALVFLLGCSDLSGDKSAGPNRQSSDSVKKQVFTVEAPPTNGAYSQAVISGPWVFCSPQGPVDARTGQVAEGGVEAQTRRAMENLRAVLEAAGSTTDHVVKTTVYLTNRAHVPAVDEVLAEYFLGAPPARATVQVVGLPMGALVEIEALAKRIPPSTLEEVDLLR